MVEDILICFGTRPEWLKVKPIAEKLDNVKLLFTGQHPDLLKDVEVDYRINIGPSEDRLTQIISDCSLQFPNEEFKYVMVHGDTVSALACALVAYGRKQKVVHIEAGIRSYNLKAPFPEEGYRQMISRIADIHLAPTSLAVSNLKQEFVKGDIHLVGNSVLDNIVDWKDKCEYGNKVLVTLHRWENHDLMHQWFIEVEKLANTLPHLDFIIPLHHHPNVQKHRDIFKKVHVVPAMNHNDLLMVLSKSSLVITDSGGIQEEGSFLNKKVLVCREVTERPEGIDSGHLFLVKDPKDLGSLFIELLKQVKIDNPCPFGDGTTADKIKNILQ